MAAAGDHGPPEGLRPSGGFVWRTPLLPVDELRAWSRGLRAADAAERGEGTDAAVTADRVLLRGRLVEALERPEVREALYLGSPRLESAVEAWLADPDGKRGRRVERGLTRYLTRMTTRPTPFGVFGGISTGQIAQSTALTLKPRSAYRRHAQLDAGVVATVAARLAADPTLREALRIRPNDSLYRVAGQIRYVQAHHRRGRRSYRVAQIADQPALQALLTRAEHGTTLGELVAALVDADLDPEEARGAVERLLDRQVLVAELGLYVTETTPLRRFVEELYCHRGAEVVADRLAEVDEALTAVNTAGLGLSPKRYADLGETVAQLPGAEAADDPFHVVLAKPAHRATLGPRVLAALERAATTLHAQARTTGSGALSTFREVFIRRYDTAEVPLTEALDGEAGVGYGPSGTSSPLLRDVPFPSAPSPDRWTRRDDLLLQWVGDVARRGEEELALDDAAVDALRAATDPPPLPRTLAVVATLLARSGEAVDRGDFRLLAQGLSAASGARALGRFCHADPAVHEIVAAHLREEEAADPDARYAEIVHLPDGRMGNVVLRPVLRNLEVPYLGRSGAPTERQLPITDLRVSVRGDRVVLRSQRLGCRVEPRLTSAHNPRTETLPLYRFLHDLQAQGSCGDLAWEWGPLLGLPFLPRVTHGNLVLSPALWRVGPDELVDVQTLDDGARFAAVHRWRTERQLPNLVRLVEADQRLVVDLTNVLSVDSFLDRLRQRDGATFLEECFLDADDLLAGSPEGRFAHELVVPFVRADVAEPSQRHRQGATSPAATRPHARRRFGPGSEWLYVKLYTAPSVADAVLTQVVAPLVADLGARGSATGWFFLRFADPDWHLRLRLRGDADRLAGEALPALREAVGPLLADGQAWRLQLDTYERELEALGGPDAIDHVEGLFEADSDTVVEVLNALPTGDAGLDARWRLALVGLHRILADLGFGLAGARGLLHALRDEYAREHRAGTATKRALGQRFREERASLEALLATDPDPPPVLRRAREAVEARSSAWAAPLAELRALEAQQRLTISWAQLTERLLHLHANRLLRSDTRRQEYVLYDFLARLADTEVARGARR